MKDTIIKLLGGYTRKDIQKHNANILNEFQYIKGAKGKTPEEAVARLWLELNKHKE